MNTREAYKKGIENASNTYHRKFETLSENMRDSVQKQDKINEQNHRLQKQILDNEERIDRELDNIYEILGEERMPGTLGSAVVMPNTAQMMTGYTNGVLNKYNALSNMGEVELSSEVIDAIASFLTVAVEREMNKSFHKKLNILEQNGLISPEKFEMHKESVVRAKQITGLGVYAAFSLAPLVCAEMSNYLQKKDMIEFIVGIYAYINRDMSPMVKYNIIQLLSEMEIKVDEKKIESVFDKYCNNTGLAILPNFSTRNRTLFKSNGMDVLAKEIISRCDLNEIEIRNRAMEFTEDFLMIDNLSAEKIVSEAKDSLNAVSDIIGFSAISYRYFFLDFIKDVANAQKFAYYDINNDPYRCIREERSQQMENIINEITSKKSLFITNKKRKDMIEASGKMLQYSLNPNYNVQMDWNMIKREKEILKAYGI